MSQYQRIGDVEKIEGPEITDLSYDITPNRQFVPNLSKSGTSKAVGGLVALHQFGSPTNVVWLLCQHPHAGNWVTVRKATEGDFQTFAQSGLLNAKGLAVLEQRRDAETASRNGTPDTEALG